MTIAYLIAAIVSAFGAVVLAIATLGALMKDCGVRTFLAYIFSTIALAIVALFAFVRALGLSA